jgi:ribonuclease-3
MIRALTHRSFAYENGGLPTNERLEFLGDAVLGLVVTDALYCRHPDLPEGQLAKLRAAVVNMRALADVARGFDLGSTSGWVAAKRPA